MSDNKIMIKFYAFIFIVCAFLTYIVDLNEQIHFVKLDSSLISNSFCFAILSGILTGVIVALLVEIRQYLLHKRQARNALYVLTLNLYGAIYQQKAWFTYYINHKEARIESNIGHNYIQQVILTYIAQLKMGDYNTFSKRDKFKISYTLFHQQVDEIEGLVRKFFELQIIYNQVKISSLKSRDISGDVTTSSVEMCQALQEKKKELENCLVLVENFGIVFEEIDKKNFYWTKAKKKIDAMAKKIEADVNEV